MARWFILFSLFLAACDSGNIDPDFKPEEYETDDSDTMASPEESDDDLDGFAEVDGDCDDTDPTIHPDAEELVVITAGRGVIDLGGTTQAVSTGDVIYIPPAIEHELRNDNDEELLGALFINVPTGEGLQNLVAAQQQAR